MRTLFKLPSHAAPPSIPAVGAAGAAGAAGVAGAAGAAGAAAVPIGSRRFEVSEPLNYRVSFTSVMITHLEVDAIFNLVDSFVNGGGPCSFAFYIAPFCICIPSAAYGSQLGNLGTLRLWRKVTTEHLTRTTRLLASHYHLTSLLTSY